MEEKKDMYYFLNEILNELKVSKENSMQENDAKDVSKVLTLKNIEEYIFQKRNQIFEVLNHSDNSYKTEDIWDVDTELKELSYCEQELGRYINTTWYLSQAMNTGNQSYLCNEINYLKNNYTFHNIYWQSCLVNMNYSDIVRKYNEILTNIYQTHDQYSNNGAGLSPELQKNIQKLSYCIDIYVKFCEIEIAREKLMDIIKYMISVSE